MDKKELDKFVTAEEACAVVRDGDRVSYGFAYTLPHALDHAMAEKLRRGEVKGLEFVGILAMSVPEAYTATEEISQARFASAFYSGINRKMMENGREWFIPMHFSESAGYWRDIRPCDVLMIQVGPMDEEGYFNLGPIVTDTWGYADKARNIVLEVNTNMPYAHGIENKIHISQVDFVVEGDNPPIEEIPNAPDNPIDSAIARLIVDRVDSGSTLQFGIGSVPNCAGNFLAESDVKNLHCHTEMMTEAYVSLYNTGKLTGLEQSKMKGTAAYTFGGGTKALYDLIDDNPFFAVTPVDYVNDSAIIASIDKFVSINSFVEIDLYGQVCSESVGPKHISGSGGQLDFVTGAYRSKGGQSFLCSHSAKKMKDGTLKSCINPFLNPGAIVTVPRASAHMIVTEYGIANLKGLSTWERAENLINIAHPDFREQLIKDAEKLGIWCNTSKCTW